MVVLLILLLSRIASAQVTGEVQTIGYENYYRPTAWTPMVVRLTSQSDQSADYQIRVYQDDLDRDRPIFTRQVTVTGTTPDGPSRDQRFRMYFMPTPIDHGLPDATDPGATLASLQKRLSVQLWTTNNKFVAELPLTSTILNVDGSPSHGCKLILAVSAGRSIPPHREYDGNTVGLLEDVAMVTVKTDSLPENPIGYDGIDAVLWMDADPADLSSGGDEKLRALQQYVHNGGHLVICQQPDTWQKTLEFGDLLPVTLDGVRAKTDGEPLRSLARPQRSNEDADLVSDPWQSLTGPFSLGVARIKPGGTVDQWIGWPDTPATPYLARRPVGFGCVSWVAQDLGDPNLSLIAGSNWPVLWNRIFDWKDQPMNTTRVSKDAHDSFAEGQKLDASVSLLTETDLPGKGLGLISLAVLSFIAYWLVAGPGTYFYLVAKKRTEASWPAFAGAAVVFTCLTALLVKLVLRGPPELKHFSLARSGAGEASHVMSRLGLYVPRDGVQTIELTQQSPGASSNLTAMSVSPLQVADAAGNDIGQPYNVLLPDPADVDPPVLSVPFRSTMKKFDAAWTGTPAAAFGISGTGKRNESGGIDGKLTNTTGRDLIHVYLAYKRQALGSELSNLNGDYMLYLPLWPAGATLDIASEFTTEYFADGTTRRVPFVGTNGVDPGRGRKCVGRLQAEWSRFWFQRGGTYTGNDATSADQSMIILSLFSRITPDRKTSTRNDRFEMLRPGAHRYDLSPAVAAGSLVVIATSANTSPNPVPLPLTVDGRSVGGDGTTLYQFVVPVDQGDISPSTQPSKN